MYPLPKLEAERIIALQNAHILYTPPEPEFDAVIALLHDFFDLPICLVSLLDTHRQWFKAQCGLEVDSTDRGVAFCSYALLSDDVLVVRDALLDARFIDNPLVTGAPHIRFYAGAPLLIRPGVALGTLCVIGREPRDFGANEAAILQRLAQIVTGLIGNHRLAHEATQSARQAETQRQLIQEQARDLTIRERRFLQTERLASVGGWELDLVTNSVGWSDETYRIYELPGGTPVDIDLALSPFPPKERARLEVVIKRAIADGRGYDEEFEIETVSGAWKWIRVLGEAEFMEGVPKRLFGTIQDVSERHLAEEKLWKAANRDSLTGLVNRHRFDEMLLSGYSSLGATCGMLMVDADRLKEVNDTLGHDAGDGLIRTVANRLREAVGGAGTVARVGGDEFAVLVPAPVTPEVLAFIAEDILASMAPWFEFDGNTIKPSVSIGGAIRTVDGDPEGLRQSADLALYHAKATRRGGYVFFYADLKSAIVARVTAINTVDEALSAGRVFASYQPVIELTTGRVSGLEALARIRLGGGVHSIGEFAEALHDRRTATRLTACMLDRIEADVVGWREAGIRVPRVAFNVGALDFEDGAIEARILSTCERACIEPCQFGVEVTESVFVSRGANVVTETAARLRAIGVIVALDDFGTGHASLAHLGTFPVDVIKMDHSFVMRMSDGGPGAVIAAALVALAHKLGIQVIAEGVETAIQLEQLRSLGCEKVQGNLISEALRPDSVASFLELYGPPRPEVNKRTASAWVHGSDIVYRWHVDQNDAAATD